jgi:hypothetical protein
MGYKIIKSYKFSSFKSKTKSKPSSSKFKIEVGSEPALKSIF